jgi:hypothetical protein
LSEKDPKSKGALPSSPQDCIPLLPVLSLPCPISIDKASISKASRKAIESSPILGNTTVAKDTSSFK